ncbi:roadblock/LC7 domain-containing protein [Methanolacinia paynteri]|uniref:roadblock/LC7 domain-containing protein n=1 Tax=Methanolacinia paynteri TaxID=230356 RepID=UPI00064F689E|nr:roadblock/LC7 domain-containing protein [Methanolacinia paynteri]
MNASLPAGEHVGCMEVSLDKLFELSRDFTGCIVIEYNNSRGFVLADAGTPVAAGYAAGDLKLSGMEAYKNLLKKESLDCVLKKYTDDELDEANILVRGSFSFDISELEGREASSGDSSDEILSEKTLQNVLRQPGVKAVSLFFEGFALHSAGDADFEQVAALSEDLVRSANQITADLGMDSSTQLILETPQGKLIISPVGDLFICILAETDCQLGLIRLVIQSIKHDLGEI